MEQLISVRSLFKDTDAYAGKEIKVGGWVRNLRASKNFGFINLSDGTFSPSFRSSTAPSLPISRKSPS